MKISTTAQRIAAIVVAIAALAVAGVAQAATSRPATMSKAEYRALVIRSEALNQKYHLGQWQGVPQGMTPSEYRALRHPRRGAEQAVRPRQVEQGFGDAVGEPLERVLLGSLRNRCGSDARAVLVGIGVIAGNRQRHNAPSVRIS